MLQSRVGVGSDAGRGWGGIVVVVRKTAPRGRLREGGWTSRCLREGPFGQRKEHRAQYVWGGGWRGLRVRMGKGGRLRVDRAICRLHSNCDAKALQGLGGGHDLIWSSQ